MSPTTDFHLDVVWALVTERDSGIQLDLCKQRSRRLLMRDNGLKNIVATVANTYMPRTLVAMTDTSS